jgi:flavin reductase (DIM6/NTAB) family NADH-FMN oxidoreductase RutF
VIAATDFRDALKDFATGVTVVTTSDAGGAPVGATVSAFTSLSVDPPLILVCLRDGSRTTAAIRERGAFAVHFLDKSQASLAQKFAMDRPDKFDDVPYSLDEFGVPCIDASLRILECRVECEYAGGDHLIFIGLVESSRHGESFEPLLYSQRHYYGLGEEVEL